MSFNRSRSWVAVAAFALVSAPSMLFAQPGAFGGGYGPPLQVVPPPRAFATSDEHYKYLLDAGQGRHEAHARVRAALGRPVGDRRQHPHEHLHRPAGVHRQGPAGRADPALRGGVSRALAAAAGARRGPVQSPHPLRAARVSTVAARAVLARVPQPAAPVVPDQRLRPGDPARLHRPGAQERVRHALLVRRHDRILGRRQARHPHEIPAARRLHALVADDEQSVRIG